MTSSQNLSPIEPWLYRTPPNFADTWLSETQTLTLALQQSLSSDHSLSSALELAPEPASPAPEVAVPPRRGTIPATGKATKRRSRASKRATTTFITADPANFREMVQQVTGVRFAGGGFPAGMVAKPEPIRAAGKMQGCLPTLDTSAFLLEQNYTLSGQNCTLSQQSYTPSFSASVPPPAMAGGGGGGGGFDFESFCSFPTLESFN